MDTIADEPAAGRTLGAGPNDGCFACGDRHPHGLHLRFTRHETHGVQASWQADETWEGFHGVIHGGIIATVLDEAMSKAVMAAGVSGLTCELRVRLRQRVESTDRLHVHGWVVDHHRRRIATEATLQDEHGRERAHAWGIFLA